MPDLWTLGQETSGSVFKHFKLGLRDDPEENTAACLSSVCETQSPISIMAAKMEQASTAKLEFI